jgi:uncharacterized protein YbaP (TraB family)
MAQIISPLFWKISGAPVHLLGSAHLGPADGIVIPEPVLNEFDSADRLFFEIQDLDTPPGPFMLRASGSLQTEMPPDLYAAVQAHRDYSANVERFNLACVQMALVLPIFERQKLISATGIDPMLCARARAQGRTMEGLESRREQEAALICTTPEEALRGLRIFLTNPEAVERMSVGLIRAAYGGDAAALSGFRDLMKHLAPIRAHALLEAREERWLSIIEEIIRANRSTFIVAGCLHMAQSGGIIMLLEQAGYELERIE